MEGLHERGLRRTRSFPFDGQASFAPPRRHFSVDTEAAKD